MPHCCQKSCHKILWESLWKSGKKLFWSIKNSGEVLNKLKSRGFRVACLSAYDFSTLYTTLPRVLNKLKSRGFHVTSLSTYDFSTLYTTLPHNLIKEKLINLMVWTFKREGSLYIACNERQAFFTSGDTKRYKPWSCQNLCEALIYLLDNIYIRFGTKLYRQIVGIPMGTNCAPLVADLFLFCYERDFMTSLPDVKQAEIIKAFKSTSKYLDDPLDIDNPYFEETWSIVFNHLNCSLTKLIPLIPKPRFWICIYLFQTDLFHLKFMLARWLWFWYSKFSIFGWWRSPFYLLRGLHFSTYSVC